MTLSAVCSPVVLRVPSHDHDSRIDGSNDVDGGAATAARPARRPRWFDLVRVLSAPLRRVACAIGRINRQHCVFDLGRRETLVVVWAIAGATIMFRARRTVSATVAVSDSGEGI